MLNRFSDRVHCKVIPESSDFPWWKDWYPPCMKSASKGPELAVLHSDVNWATNCYRHTSHADEDRNNYRGCYGSWGGTYGAEGNNCPKLDHYRFRSWSTRDQGYCQPQEAVFYQRPKLPNWWEDKPVQFKFDDLCLTLDKPELGLVPTISTCTCAPNQKWIVDRVKKTVRSQLNCFLSFFLPSVA